VGFLEQTRDPNKFPSPLACWIRAHGLSVIREASYPLPYRPDATGQNPLGMSLPEIDFSSSSWICLTLKSVEIFKK